MVAEVGLRPVRQQRQQYFGEVFRSSRMRFYPDHSKMQGKRQHDPVAEVFVQSDQGSLFGDGFGKDNGVVCPSLARSEARKTS